MTADGEIRKHPGTKTSGRCDPRFSRVREVFDKHFAGGEELGAAFAVYLDGEPVVDLWGGVADRRTGRPWEHHTPALAYSCTKAVTATAGLLLAERGLLDLTAPVADVWPEFGQRGKERITVEQLFTHQCGLPTIEEPVPVEEFEDHAAIAARLARQEPIWEPGTAHGYHALTYGFLLSEVISRVSGKSVGEIVSTEIAGPLGLELWIGAPDDVAARAARLSAGDRVKPGGAGGPRAAGASDAAGASGASGAGAPSAPAETDAGAATPPSTVAELPGQGPGDPVYEMARASLDKDSLMNRALGNPGVHRLPGGANHPVILRAGWPAMGVVATARGLAGFYRELVAGRILRPETLRDAMRRRVNGPDRVLFIDSSFGLGYMRPALTFLTPARGAETAFGHTGLGGFLGLGDVEHGLAMGYTMNKMANAVSGSLRAYRLAEAVYDALG
ncbi:beta-lactamase family protein [Planomonospora sp. ID67723]|uniref:serine hydrolase domain-containing protein n=1 Tax=Planomonospora sp. ID67723 TaxID=2738134 RepID=UPI0018C38F2E|nr:serine hydrolase domain-containing protein [Planomonospora sp. ID67723]MBG0828695.1 beta-lactamase family protein [Planomonospora sp. ID67723]